MAIVPDGVHPSIQQQVKNLVGVVFWGIISYWGTGHVVLVTWGSVWGDDKCGKTLLHTSWRVSGLE